MSQDQPAFVAGIDVGGTFTDFVLFRPTADGGVFTHHKEPSTPSDPARAVADGLPAAMALAGIARDAAGVVLHGTTIALNTILQDKGAPVALITSRGNRDVLEIGRARMPSSFNFALGKERRVVPRDRVLECGTRIGPNGVALARASDVELDEIAARIRGWQLPAVAVMLLNSYVDKTAEVDVAARLSARLPGTHMVASAEIWPEIREYERALVAVLNAQITPLMDSYLRGLETLLRRAGIKATVFITASNGGVLSLATARTRPIDTILSGPATGVTAAVAIAGAANVERIVSFDMGGTSTDISMVRRGVPEFTNQTSVGDLPVILPSVDVSAIGAGGGSIVHLDAQGLLKVGPESAGAAPGPAAYGRGGTRPTITDCYLVNGWIDPDHFLGGRMRLDRAKAHAALAALARDARHAELKEPEAVADAALRIATTRMATGLTRHLAQKGEDAHSFTLLPFGGAGPTHAGFLATETGIARILVPRAASTFCALGALLARVKRAYAASLGADRRDLAKGHVWPLFETLETQARQWIAQEGQLLSQLAFAHSADMRYRGQAFDIEVAIPRAVSDARSAAGLYELFHAEHERLYGFREERGVVEVVTARVTVSAEVCKVPLRRAQAKQRGAPPHSAREVYHDGKRITYAVYQRADLAAGARIEGPAIIEQSDTTIPVLPGWQATVDAFDNLMMERPKP
ncbi:MAG TPA: hydantoinase/oxoprolinase family protein [Xanthobacteraceae bacterium]|nr:hydantoinase/oxoprolinase family protein [Xanthobacteraceae bacterium]